MYVCHCNRIPERDIRAAIDAVSGRSGTTTASPADVLLELNRFGKCLGCFPLIESMISGTHTDITPSQHMHATDSEVATSPTTSTPRRRRGGAFARRPEA